MQKLIKRRMRSYLHPTGIHVRAYEDEKFPFPPDPRPPVSAPADNTRYINPTPEQRLIPNDKTHNDALYSTAVAAGAAAMSGAIGGPANALRAGVAAAAVTMTATCGNCHRKKN